MTDHDSEPFNRKEQEFLDTLHGRLDWLRIEGGRFEGEHTEANGFFKGEASALAWAIELIEGGTEPVVARLARMERRLRKMASRLGRVEHDLYADDEEVTT